MSPERKSFFLHLMIFALAGSALTRTLLAPCPPHLPAPYLHAMLGLYVALLLASIVGLRPERVWLIRSYLALQSALVLAMMLAIQKESPAMMLFALGIQALFWLPTRESGAWLAAKSLIMLGSLVSFYGPLRGLATAPIYASGFLFMGLFTYLLEQQEKATDQSQTLLRELREAYQKLQVYTTQAEELAVSKERNRIARELHDSVTQMLFSMNLLTQTTRVLAQREAPQLSEQLGQLQGLTQDALAEMRYLLFQLRPGGEGGKGFLPALRQHIHDLQARHSLAVTLQADAEPPLSSDQAHKLFRITQEALNNVVKHADTDAATVRLELESQQLTLCIEDRGVGYSPDDAPGQNDPSMGLSSMQERASLLGASFQIQSSPGQGTRIHVVLPMEGATQGA